MKIKMFVFFVFFSNAMNFVYLKNHLIILQNNLELNIREYLNYDYDQCVFLSAVDPGQ